MKAWLNRRGGITVEFVALVPLLLLTVCFILQLAICVMAIVETENTIRDEARYAASTGQIVKAEKDGKKKFGLTKYYHLKSFDVYQKKLGTNKLGKPIWDNHITVRAVTKIKVVFLPDKYITYHSKKKSIIIYR
ncbi:TadE/TadG family type IV pilus assembly protein [Marininema halotolerans]|uniref:TadE/TadG family type IV pilus assembly protein n=1 Tax=Marininema halotolerans TaxID=1155944 RepID=UPI000B82436F|nr:hypothetical protein [Marininema halotolerans]